MTVNQKEGRARRFWYACRVGIALVYLAAAVPKFFHVDLFRVTLQSYYGFLPDGLALFMALVFPWLEFGLALLLLVYPKRQQQISLTLLLLSAFMLVQSVLMLNRVMPYGCGCFGFGEEEVLGWGGVIRNLLILDLAFLAWWGCRKGWALWEDGSRNQPAGETRLVEMEPWPKDRPLPGEELFAVEEALPKVLPFLEEEQVRPLQQPDAAEQVSFDAQALPAEPPDGAAQPLPAQPQVPAEQNLTEAEPAVDEPGSPQAPATAPPEPLEPVLFDLQALPAEPPDLAAEEEPALPALDPMTQTLAAEQDFTDQQAAPAEIAVEVPLAEQPAPLAQAPPVAEAVEQTAPQEPDSEQFAVPEQPEAQPPLAEQADGEAARDEQSLFQADDLPQAPAAQDGEPFLHEPSYTSKAQVLHHALPQEQDEAAAPALEPPLVEEQTLFEEQLELPEQAAEPETGRPQIGRRTRRRRNP